MQPHIKFPYPLFIFSATIIGILLVGVPALLAPNRAPSPPPSAQPTLPPTAPPVEHTPPPTMSRPTPYPTSTPPCPTPAERAYFTELTRHLDGLARHAPHVASTTASLVQDPSLAYNQAWLNRFQPHSASYISHAYLMQEVEIPSSLANLGKHVNRYMALVEDYGYALREYALNPVGLVPLLPDEANLLLNQATYMTEVHCNS